MERVLKSVETELSRHSPTVKADEQYTPMGDRPKETVEEEHDVDIAFDAEVPGRVYSIGPGKNVFVPDVDEDDHSVTVPDLKILDQSSPDVGESTGIDPYDTGVFQIK